MLLLRFRGRWLSCCRLDWLTFGDGAILTLNWLTFHHWFFLDVVSSSLALLCLFLVFFTLLLRLHNVVHKVVEVLIIHLLICVVVLGRLCIELLPLALVPGAFLLSSSPLPLPRYPVKVIGDAVLGVASTHALSALRLSLVHLKLVAVVKCLVAGGCRRSLVPFPGGAHLLLVLLLTLQLLLLLHKLRARVLVQVEIEGTALIEIFVRLWNWMAVIFDLLNFVKVLL